MINPQKLKIFSFTPWIFIFAISITSCFKKSEVSPIPAIQFLEFKSNKDTANLFFKFVDGDGDIGLTQNDTTPPNNYNCFIAYFEKQQGKWVERILPYPFNYRIPPVNSSSRNKTVEGQIKIEIKPYYYDPFSAYDTIRYKLYIMDRALNKSNEIYTPEIITP